MQFQPKSEQEIQEANLLQPGAYDFEVVEGEDKTSNAGNEMIHLKLRVFNENGGSLFVDDYLLEKLAYKLRHAAESMGLIEKYESGVLNGVDFVTKVGKAKIAIDKSKDPQYSDKNKVTDYIVDKDTLSPNEPIANDLDDDIPF